MFISPGPTHPKSSAVNQTFSPPPRLGELLQQAELITNAQIEVALRDQSQYADLLLGEILTLRGWLKQETADFFAQQWPQLINQNLLQPLGVYLKAAALLDQQQIDSILKEQYQTGLKFGAAAILKGYLKQATIDLFLTYLFPDQPQEDPFICRKTNPGIQTQPTTAAQNPAAAQTTAAVGHPSKVDSRETLIQAKGTLIQDEDNEIHWVG